MNEYNYYYHANTSSMWWEDNWPSIIRDKFSDYIGNTLTISFVFPSNSDIERQFLKQAKDNGVDLKKEVVRDLLDKSTIRPDSFAYVGIDKLIQLDERSYVSFDNACGGTSNHYCDQGKVQIKKIVLEPSKTPKLDIFMVERSGQIIVSNKFYKLIKGSDVRGIKFIPCLSSDKEYSEDELKFESFIGRDVSSHDFMQLLPDENIISAPALDWEVIEDGCPKCDAVTFFLSLNNLRFEKKSLKNDLYLVDTIRSNKNSLIPLNMHQLVFSSKLLSLFRKNKLKGLGPYYFKPNPVINFPELKYL